MVGVGYGVIGAVGVSAEPSHIAGVEFTGADVYPDDINNGPTGTTYVIRAGTYGDVDSHLQPPEGTKIYAYNNEAVLLNGRVTVNDSNVWFGGIHFRYTNTVDGGAGDPEEKSVMDITKSSAGSIGGIRVSGCKIEGNICKHILDIHANIDGIDILNTELVRYGGGANVSGDPSEFWVQDDGTYYPTNVYASNIYCESTAAGTHDSVQIQNGGVVYLEHFGFGGQAPSENYADFKTDGNDDYHIKRWKIPAKGSALISRANIFIEECWFEGGGSRCQVEVGVNDQTPHISDFKIHRCIWEDQGGTADADRALVVQETDSCEIIGCIMEGGQYRVQTDGTGVVFRSNYITNARLNNSGGVTCEDNYITGGTGWSGCTNTQPATPPGPINQIQTKTGTSGADSVAATFDATPTNGNLLVGVFYGKKGTPSPSISGATASTGYLDFSGANKGQVANPIGNNETDLPHPTTSMDIRLDIDLVSMPPAGRMVAAIHSDGTGSARAFMWRHDAGTASTCVYNMNSGSETDELTKSSYWVTGRMQYRMEHDGTTVTFYKRNPATYDLPLADDNNWTQEAQTTTATNISSMNNPTAGAFVFYRRTNGGGMGVDSKWYEHYIAIDGNVESTAGYGEITLDAPGNEFVDEQGQDWDWGTATDPTQTTGDRGDAFTKTVDLQTGTHSDRLTIFWKEAGISEPTTITCSYETSTDNAALVIAEYSPGSGKTWPAAPVDVSQFDDIDQNVTSKTTGTTAATAQADELAIAGWGLRDTSATGRSFTNGFSEVGYANWGSGDTQALLAEKILTAIGTQETTASWTGLNDATAGIICFKNA